MVYRLLLVHTRILDIPANILSHMQSHVQYREVDAPFMDFHALLQHIKKHKYHHFFPNHNMNLAFASDLRKLSPDQGSIQARLFYAHVDVLFYMP